MEKKWKKIESKIWKPENEGDSIEGVVIAKEARDGDQSAKYHLENSDGVTMVWGSTVLDDKMQQVKVGDEIRITYEGQKKLEKGKKLNKYEVEIAEATSDNSDPSVEEEKVE